MLTAVNGIPVALLAVLVVILGIIGLRAYRRSRVTPEETERRRRAMLASIGKMGDADIVDLTDDLIVYSYMVAGVVYTATQDVSRLTAFLPGDLSALGHVVVKYDPRNPANSMVLAEDWTGFQGASHFTPTPRR